ncbi:hypothetical protein RvY_13221 [Ramazzottius varieornatus]|uniref:Rho-GAP domain-containing protein n=1 Tax=Ramazzottius varieornatus TaxID=947166 RepID=A0A1D1VM54_RAMVA|nr:hypothetical protein RvY_13221 [Ramazzottius varieornatus]
MTSCCTAMEDPVASVKILSRKLGDDPKLLRKNLDKAQKLRDEVDFVASKNMPEVPSIAKSDAFVFGLPLESLKPAPALIEYKRRSYRVTIPAFIKELGDRLLKCDGTTGLFRIPPNAKRLEVAIDSIENGNSLDAIPNLHAHDYCGLLKQWARELPSPLLPDVITGYFLKVFERLSTGKLTKEEACRILVHLASFVPKRYKETMAYISLVMSSIAKDSDKNGMSARNLAICCPNLFIGSYAQRVLDGRQFQAMMYLMEFFIVNPHAFLPVESAATIVQDADDSSWATLRKNSPMPKLDFPHPQPHFHPDIAGAVLPIAFNKSQKKNGTHGFATPRSARPFRGLGRVAVDLKNKMGRMAIPSCLKPGSEDSMQGKYAHRLEGSMFPATTGPGIVQVDGSPEGLRASPVSGVFPMPTAFSEEISAMITPPRDQFRTHRRSSTRTGSIITRRSFEDITMLGTPAHIDLSFGTVPLDFEDVIELMTPVCTSRSIGHGEPSTPHSAMSCGDGKSSSSPDIHSDLHLEMAKGLASTSFCEMSASLGATR